MKPVNDSWNGLTVALAVREPLFFHSASVTVMAATS
jgi:hypothetical protein